MRRLRKSVHPAISDKSTAPARINGFKRASGRAGERAAHMSDLHDIEKNPFSDEPEAAGGQGR
jgi:hypothetical protein